MAAGSTWREGLTLGIPISVASRRGKSPISLPQFELGMVARDLKPR